MVLQEGQYRMSVRLAIDEQYPASAPALEVLQHNLPPELGALYAVQAKVPQHPPLPALALLPPPPNHHHHRPPASGLNHCGYHKHRAACPPMAGGSVPAAQR